MILRLVKFSTNEFCGREAWEKWGKVGVVQIPKSIQLDTFGRNVRLKRQIIVQSSQLFFLPGFGCDDPLATCDLLRCLPMRSP